MSIKIWARIDGNKPEVVGWAHARRAERGAEWDQRPASDYYQKLNTRSWR